MIGAIQSLKWFYFGFGSLGKYRKVASFNTSCLDEHAGFFKLLMKGIFDSCVLWPFNEKLVTHVCTPDSMVYAENIIQLCDYIL